MRRPPRALRRSYSPVLLLAAGFLSLVFASRARAESRDDVFWSGDFAAPAFDGPVFALQSYEDRLVAGGSFSRNPTGPSSAAAAWDGTQWLSMGSEISHVRHLAVWRGELLATGGRGSFSAGARWNGSEWDSLFGDLRGYVAGFCTLGGDLIAAGTLAFADSFVLAARWNGTAWHPLGTAVAPPTIAEVEACTEFEGKLWIAGRFSAPPYTRYAYTLRWSGSAWDTLDAGFSGKQVSALAVHEGRLYAGGYDHGPNTTGTALTRWNGSRWESVGGYRDGVWCLLSTPAGLVIGGNFETPAGDRATVAIVRDEETLLPGLSGTVFSLAWREGTIVAGGMFVGSGASSAAGRIPIDCARWDGATWQPLEGVVAAGHGLLGVNQAVVHDLFTTDDTLFACGRFDVARDGDRWSTAHSVARWDGSRWIGIGNAPIEGWIHAMTRFRGDLIIGGDFTIAGPDGEIRNIARWSGSEWRPLGARVDGQVRAMAVLRDALVIGGTLMNAGGAFVRSVARWDGDTWDAMGPGELIPGAWPMVNAMLVLSDTLYVGGTFERLGGVSARNIVRFDGVDWSALGNGLDREVRALELHQGRLLAAGGPDLIAGVADNGLAAWDGERWNVVPIGGDSLFTAIDGMLSAGEDLYAAGSFDAIRGRNARNVARWDGIEWHALGSGLGSDRSPWAYVHDLIAFDGSIWFGGDFQRAGGKPSSLVARWDPAGSRAGPPMLALANAYPNPSSTGVTLPLSVGRAARVEARVFDLAGRTVRDLLHADLDSGDHIVTWSGRDHEDRKARPGLYVIVLRANGVVAGSRKVVVLP